MKIEFPRAVPGQAEILSDLAIESKGYWGYSNARLETWRKDLRIEKEYIAAHLVRTIVVDGRLIGFFAIKRDASEDVLDHLWLSPEAIGRGIGGLTFRKIREDCAALGIVEIAIISDPNAEGFYLRQGAVRIGEVESVPQNRMLPKLCYRMEDKMEIEEGERAALVGFPLVLRTARPIGELRVVSFVEPRSVPTT